jgi:pilus assembly protein Flp/PilA
MKKLVSLVRKLHDDKSGASMIEYSVLIGVILAVSVATVVAVGTWSGTQWTNLQGALP